MGMLVAGMAEGNMPFLSRSFQSETMLVGGYDRPVPSQDSVNALMQWVDRGDDPWHPSNLAPPENNQTPSQMHGTSVRSTLYQSYGPYRNNYQPSECETGIIPPSDSGYGSHGAKQSIATGSVYEEALDRNPETQRLAGHFGDMNFSGFSDMSSKTGMQPTWTLPPSQLSMIPRLNQAGDGKELICETCKKTLKTNSELKKHRQRHSKPYRCEVRGCTRQGGFSTTNDLDRHKRSRHPELVTAGNRYQCSLGSCKAKEKLWPRADNFRAHLKRCHQLTVTEDAMENYIYRPRPPLAQGQDMLPDLTGVQQPHVDYRSFGFSSHIENLPPYCWHQDGQILELPEEPETGQNASQVRDVQPPINQSGESVDPENHDTDAESIDEAMESSDNVAIDVPLSTATGSTIRPASKSPMSVPIQEQSTGTTQFVAPGDLSHFREPTMLPVEGASNSSVDGGKSWTRSSESQSPSTMSVDSPTPDTKTSDDESMVHPEEPDEMKGKDSATSTCEPLNTTAGSSTQLDSLHLDLKDPAKVKKLVETLQNQGILKKLGFKKVTSPAAEGKAVGSVTGSPLDNQICSTCKKGFARRCELRKHMKRHEKPYGCTFGGCSKKFGSKNDWKRHENSQHFLLEIWKCDQKKADNPNETCGRVSHRRETFKDHLSKAHSLEGDIIEEKVEKCRVGRNCEARFWCGFCQAIVAIQSKGGNTWTERYNHIDDHLNGRHNMPKKHIDDWKNIDPDAPPARADASGSDTDDNDSSPSASALPRNVALPDLREGQTSRPARRKRGADNMEDVRPSKKTKGHRDTVVTRCCQCGEGNSRSRFNTQCVSASCQHPLCPNCV